MWPAADRYVALLAAAAGIPHLVVTEHIVGAPNSGGQRLKRRELWRADAVTVVCASVADSLARDYGVDRARLRVVPNGADLPDLEAERPASRRLRDHFGAALLRPLWVCAARLEEQKGHTVLLDALAEVRRRGHEFVCALAGASSGCVWEWDQFNLFHPPKPPPGPADSLVLHGDKLDLPVAAGGGERLQIELRVGGDRGHQNAGPIAARHACRMVEHVVHCDR